MIRAAKSFVKALLKRSPIPLTQNHRYDLQTKAIFKRVLRRNSNCIDVGCHKGEILDLMLAQAPNGEHFGYEPIPALAQNLQTKYGTNKQVTIRNVALSNKTGEANFNYVVSNPSYSGLKKRDYDRKGEEDMSIRVATTLLDDEVPAGMRIDLIKIDVEGGELLVLEGAQRLLAEQQPVVVFEHGLGASEHYGSTPDKVYELLAKANLRISTLDHYLADKPAMSLREFRAQYDERKNYYFIGHR